MHSKLKESVRWVFVLAAVVALAIGVAACGSSSDSSSSASSEASTSSEEEAPSGSTEKPLEGKTIAYIQTGSLEYYEYSAEGAKTAIEVLGGTPEVLNSELDPSKELANVQDAITKQVDGIVLFPLSDASEKAAVKEANDAGIPISIVGIIPLKEVQPMIAGDAAVHFMDYAKVLGEAFAEVVPTGPVAMITGLEGRQEVVEFKQAFAEGFGDSSRIVEEVDGEYLRPKAFSLTQDIMAKYPDLKGLIVQNEDMAVGAVQALGSKIGQVAVTSQNGSPVGNELLEKEKLKVTIGASPTQEATLSVRLLAEDIAGEPAAEKICATPFALNYPGEIKSEPYEATPALVEKWIKTTKCAGPDGK
ncbi:MAG: sugar ABC transporter substrate-binding protein [Actinobacteria bacterium]|nr:sugar ABC transporter substrate-binding protein [Actinomycetota bacterium]